MTLVTGHFAGMQPATTDATTANTGLNQITLNGGTAVFISDGIRFTSNGGTTCSGRKNLAAANDVASFRIRFRLNAIPTAATSFFVPRWSGGRAISCYFDNNATPRLFFATSAAVFGGVAWSGLTIGNVYELAFWGTVSTGAGVAKLYQADGTTVIAPAATAAAAYGSSTATQINFVAYNMGTNPFAAVDMGVVLGATATTAVDVLDIMANDGLNSEIAHYTPAANVAPTLSTGPAQVSAVNLPVTVTSTATDTDGTISAHAGAFTVLPIGVTAPALSGSASGLGTATSTLSQTFTPTVPGRYVWKPTATDNGGLGASNIPTTEIIVTNSANLDNYAFDIVQGSWVLFGAETDPVKAVGDGLASTGLQSPDNPTNQAVRFLAAAGPGAITAYIEGQYVGGATNRTVTFFKRDGTTVVYAPPMYALPSVSAEKVLAFDSAAHALVPLATDRVFWVQLVDSI